MSIFWSLFFMDFLIIKKHEFHPEPRSPFLFICPSVSLNPLTPPPLSSADTQFNKTGGSHRLSTGPVTFDMLFQSNASALETAKKIEENVKLEMKKTDDLIYE